MDKVLHSGGCHCGKVRYEFWVPAEMAALDCNCSICSRTGYLHIIVAASDFNLLRGEQDLSDYQFNTKTAHHLFCQHCGVKSFYRPRSHPGSISVNANCVDAGSVKALTVEGFDGRHWQKAAENL